MIRKNYTLYEIVCPSCKTLNTYELPIVDTTFEGRLPPIWANNRRLSTGERSFPCHSCQHIIEIRS